MPRLDVAKARQLGYSDEQVKSYAASKGVTLYDSTPQQQPQAQGKGGFKFSDLYSTIGGIVGGIGGGLVASPTIAGIPAGVLAGGALGATAGDYLRQRETGGPIDVGSLAGEGALGAAGPFFGKGLGFVGKKLLGGTLGKAGEYLGTKSSRLNKSQLLSFTEKHGEDAIDFMNKEKALGKSAEQIMTDHVNPLQEDFNRIAKLSGLKVNPDVFLKNIDEQTKELLKAGGSENRALAQRLGTEALDVWEKDLSPNNFDISKVDELRRTFANKVNWNDPSKATVDYAMADALRKTAIDTADKAGLKGSTSGLQLRDIGMKLSKYRDLDRSLTAQEQLGRGNLPLGITGWLSAIGGYGAGGPPGAIATVAAKELLTNPRTMGLGARGALGASERINAGVLPADTINPARQIVGQPGIRTLFGGGGNDQPIEGQMLPPDQTSLSLGNPQQDRQEKVRQAFGLAMLSKAKTPSDLAAAYKFFEPTSPKSKSVTGAVRLSLAKSGIRNLQTAKQELAKDPSVLTKNLIPGQFFTRQFDSSMFRTVEALLRMRTGAAAPEQEVRRYMNQFAPRFGDSPTVIQTKLANLEADLYDALAESGSIQDTVPLPESFSLGQ